MSIVNTLLTSNMLTISTTTIASLKSIIVPTITSILALFITVRLYFSQHRRKCCNDNGNYKGSRRSIAFFHPHCSAGGGGERVLWKAVEALQELNDSQRNGYGDEDEDGNLVKIQVVVYTCDAYTDTYCHGEDIDMDIIYVYARYVYVENDIGVLFTPRILLLYYPSFSWSWLLFECMRGDVR